MEWLSEVHFCSKNQGQIKIASNKGGDIFPQTYFFKHRGVGTCLGVKGPGQKVGGKEQEF